MPNRTADFIMKGYTVFDNALKIEEIKFSLSQYGYDEKKLKEERQKIVEFEEANNRQEAAKGEAQQATKNQEIALDNLNKWLSQYIKIARVALKDKKQLLEKLGINVYSSKPSVRRKSTKAETKLSDKDK